MTIGGSFDVRTTALSGTLTVGTSRSPAFDGSLADLRTLDTGISLRNKHLRETYLEVNKGPGYDQATVSEIDLKGLNPNTPQGKGSFTGALTLHGVTKAVTGSVDVRQAGGGLQVKASFPINLSDYSISPNSAARDGRTLADAAFISYEHWVSYQTEQGLTVRAGRFLPAYGVRFADHTTFTRAGLDLDRNDQVYGVEVSDAIGPSLVQVMVSPGKAEAILHDRDHRGFSTAGRWQYDVAPRMTIVGSGFYRAATNLDPKSGSVGGAFGIAPMPRVSIWTEVDASLQTKTIGGRQLVVVNETAVEAYRGIWLKFSPQFRSSGGQPGFSNVRRLAFEADLLPRTHWNVGVSFYHDNAFDASTSTLLTQLHLYL
jgi:hypothetical protein